MTSDRLYILDVFLLNLKKVNTQINTHNKTKTKFLKNDQAKACLNL